MKAEVRRRGILRTRRGPVTWGETPRLFGILNVTPDSFSDGGRFVEIDRAVAHALCMQADGAAVIDVGGLSTRPGSKAVDAKEEIRRVVPVIEALVERLDIPVSVDTYRAEVFRAAWQAGADILNDVSALDDPDMPRALGETEAPVVLMHMQGSPATMQRAPRYDDVVHEVRTSLEAAAGRLAQAGVDRSRVVIDPGIGFGKTLDHNLELLRKIDAFHETGYPVLVGTSRKSFLGQVLDRDDPAGREYGTAATTAHLFARGVAFLRVHDVRAAMDVIRVLDRIESRSSDDTDTATWTS